MARSERCQLVSWMSRRGAYGYQAWRCHCCFPSEWHQRPCVYDPIRPICEAGGYRQQRLGRCTSEWMAFAVSPPWKQAHRTVAGQASHRVNSTQWSAIGLEHGERSTLFDNKCCVRPQAGNVDSQLCLVTAFCMRMPAMAPANHVLIPPHYAHAPHPGVLNISLRRIALSRAVDLARRSLPQ